MHIEYLKDPNGAIALVSGGEAVISDPQSALDLAMPAKYDGGAAKLAQDKSLIAEEFFILSTGLAGEILQKLTNYRVKLAIYGDFSHYTSKPLRDFIYESNQGTGVFFVLTREEAWLLYPSPRPRDA